MTIRMLFYLGIISFLVLLISCYPRKKNVPFEELAVKMELHKGPCFGKCPVYHLLIYENGKATYEGQVNAKKMGLYSKQLSKDTFHNLIKLFEAANIKQYEDRYESDLADLAHVTVAYHQDGKRKAVTGNINRPEAIKSLQGQLDKIANSSGWTLIKAAENQMEENIVPGEVIVRFHPSADIPDWINGMAAYKVRLKRKIGNSKLLWLISYDTTTSKPDEMLFRITDSKAVHTAEFNRKLQQR